MGYVQELIDAIAIEIQEQKQKKNDQIYNIYEGRKINILANEHIYLFRTGELISFLDDSIAEIEIDGISYECILNSNKQDKIQITLSTDKGKKISMGKLHLNPWFLLELLSKKLIKNLNNDNYFLNSYNLIKNRPFKLTDVEETDLKYSNANESQRIAIKHSLEMSQTIIWGPPGTGKTATIANIIQNFIKLNKSVLLVSLSNNAVDQALLKLVDSITNKDKLKFVTRLGIPKNEMVPYYKDRNSTILLWDKVKIVCFHEIEKIKNLKLTLEETKEEFSLRNKVVNDIEQKEVIFKKICDLEDHYKKMSNHLDKKGPLKKDLREYYLKLPTLLQETKQNYVLLVESIEKNLKKLKTKESKVSKALPKLFIKINQLKKELDTLSQKIESETKRIVQESLVIATTVTKSYTDKYIDSIKYDVIVVDEASMVPMPMLFWAVSKSRERTIIVGDFLQLPPICLSEYNLKFKENIFDKLKIKNIELAEVKTKLLNTQYRMNPDISKIVNEHFYENRLRNSEIVSKNVFVDSISNDNSVMLIDTYLDDPIATKIVPRSRVNLYHALLCIIMVKNIIKSLKTNESIGILTPYKKQAKLINKLLLDEKLNETYDIKVNTIHSFQGGEETVIIFDTVEGNGLKSNWSMINNEDYSECSNLLNVAITRAKSKLYIVGNYNFLQNNYPINSDINMICKNLVESRKHTYSNKIISNYEQDLYSYDKKLKIRGKIIKDLNMAEKEIIIISSDPTLRGVQNLQKSLEKLDRDVSITIMINKYSKENKKEFYEIAEYIKVSGYKFKIIDKDNQSNLIFIDRKILWFGAFDILGLVDTSQFFRVEYPLFIKELINLMRLYDIIKGINGKKCPQCNSNYIETRVNHRNKQLYHACISKKCGYTRSL